MWHITFGFFILQFLETILTVFVHLSNPTTAPLIREAASSCAVSPGICCDELGNMPRLSPVLLQLEEEPSFVHETS